MKKLIILLLIVTPFLTKELNAYRGPGKGLRRGQFRNEGICFGNEAFLKERLKLSESQLKAIGKINATYRDSLRDWQAKIRPLRMKLRHYLLADEINLTKVRSLLKEIADIEVEIRMLRIRHRRDIEKVLTKAQREQLRRERRSQRGRRMNRQ